MSSFLEGPRFTADLIDLINEASVKEKGGGGRPDFWEMVFWWTRKPLISARSIIAGLVLSGETDVGSFKRLVRLDSLKVPHRENPKIPPDLRSKLSNLKLLDPFAGFGSIPLEAIRLGIGEVVAVELLPTAYVFLKAVLEYPKWVADKQLKQEIIEDLRKWGESIIKKLKEDPDIKELYEENTAAYIGTWEIKCHYCSKYTPLIGNWWLARVKNGEQYTRIAWMEPVRTGETIEIRVRDLNKELRKTKINAKISEQQIKTSNGETWRVPEPNIVARGDIARCLHCNNTQPGKKDEWHVKKALKEWNEKLEKYLQGETTLEELKQSTARPRILTKVKIVNKELEFEPATKEDNEKLWKALEKLKQMWGDPDIPIEPLPYYDQEFARTHLWGFDKWFKLFNPRQLLTLVKLVKLIREAGKKIEEEKLKEGWSREDAHKYAEAVTTYLAIALVKQADYNSIVIAWNPATGFGSTLALLHAGHTLSFRGIAMSWNFVEYNFTIDRVGYNKFIEMIVEGLEYLVNAVSGSPSRVRVLLDDATTLSRLGDERFDLIVTDPPYHDDVSYAELSDFYYVWLKRVLSDCDGFVLRPRFSSEAFFECFDDGCLRFSEVRAQWEVFASREVSVNEGRAEHFGGAGSLESFKDKLSESFKRMIELLKDDGVVATYYAHTSPEAWDALLEAGWWRTGLRITKAFSVSTESEERVTARGKVALDSSIVIVWRGGSGGEELLQKVHSRALSEATNVVKEVLERGARLDFNLFLDSLSSVLSVYTSYSKIIPEKKVSELVKNYVFPAAVQAIVNGVGAKTGVNVRFGPEASAYVAVKTITRPKDYSKRVGRALIDRNFASVLGFAGGLDVSKLISLNIFRRNGDVLELLEPKATQGFDDASLRKSIEELLTEKNVSIRSPVFNSSIDVLHYLEYKALELDKERFKNLVDEMRGRVVGLDEALNIARVFATILPSSDPERRACSKILSYLGELRMG